MRGGAGTATAAPTANGRCRTGTATSAAAATNQNRHGILLPDVRQPLAHVENGRALPIANQRRQVRRSGVVLAGTPHGVSERDDVAGLTARGLEAQQRGHVQEARQVGTAAVEHDHERDASRRRRSRHGGATTSRSADSREGNSSTLGK